MNGDGSQPPSIQRQAKLKPGDQVEFRVSGGVINIVPKHPELDSEYTARVRGGNALEPIDSAGRRSRASTETRSHDSERCTHGVRAPQICSGGWFRRR
jgi:hypothetical protein